MKGDLKIAVIIECDGLLSVSNIFTKSIANVAMASIGNKRIQLNETFIGSFEI